MINTITVSVELGSGISMLCDFKDLAVATSGTWTERRPEKPNHTSYAVQMINGRMVRFHRLITNATQGAVVDHRNRNGLDNRRSNLRVTKQHKNVMNQSIATNNTTGYKGVSFDKSRKLFRSYIVLNDKQTHLGRYSTAEQAAMAYNAAAMRMFGEFACLNKVAA